MKLTRLVLAGSFLCVMTAWAVAGDESHVVLRIGQEEAGWATFLNARGLAIVVAEQPRGPMSVLLEGKPVTATWTAHDPSLGVGLVQVDAEATVAVKWGGGPKSRQEMTIGLVGNEVEVVCVSGERWLSFQRGSLGLSFSSDNSTRVSGVTAGSPAQRAGLQGGDEIRAFNGMPVADRATLDLFLAFTLGGQEIVIQVDRNGEKHDLPMTLPYQEKEGPGMDSFLAIEYEVTGPDSTRPLPSTLKGAPVRDKLGRSVGLHWKAYGPGRGLALAAADIDGLQRRLQAFTVPKEGAESELGKTVTYTKGAYPGYTLFSTLGSYHLYLVDMEGQPVKRWTFDHPLWGPYFLENGDVLVAVVQGATTTFRDAGGQCGRIQRQTFDGNLVWDYVLSDNRHLQHHDIEPMPNGNVLAIVWETRTREEAIAAGRNPSLVPPEGMWPVTIMEIAPAGKDGGKIVWQWHVWDHLIQDRDPDLDNYGDPADYPELVDINGSEARVLEDDELQRLRALGYLGGEQEGPPGGARGFGGGDWTHMNSIDYHPELDQIMLSARHWSEIWIIDHSTTTEEAAGHTGGRYDRGGDILYRWGNPEKYARGTPEDRKLFGQHDASWIPEGHPGAGHVLVFNNGEGSRNWSSVDELILPINPDGTYRLDEDAAFGPAEPIWSYADRGRFFSAFLSGAQRLPNGNTLICSGTEFRIFEVDRDGAVVWDYQFPDRAPEGLGGFAGPFGGRGFGPPQQSSGAGAQQDRGDAPGLPGLFRAWRISADHPALKGRDLDPMK